MEEQRGQWVHHQCPQLPQSCCRTIPGLLSLFPRFVPGFCLPQARALPLSGRVMQCLQQRKQGQMPPAASYLHQAALRAHPGLHPGPPGRWLAPSLAPPACSQTTSLRRKQQEAQPRAHISQKLPPSLQTTCLGGCDPFLASPWEAGVTPKQQSQAQENCS